MPTDMGRKVALVTGASRGIGAAIALRLAQSGCHVAVNYNKDEKGALEVVDGLNTPGSQELAAVAVQGDVANPDDVKRIVAETEAAFGPIDILVNNAGITIDGPLARMKLENFRRVLDVNLVGPFLLMQAVIPAMSKSGWGRIVNIASVTGLRGHAMQANYCAAKGGLIALSHSVADEYSRRGITVNVVAPGFVETEMTKKTPDDLRQKALTGSAVRRLGTPEDVGPLVAFLCSDGAGFITRETYIIDGGLGL